MRLLYLLGTPSVVNGPSLNLLEANGPSLNGPSLNLLETEGPMAPRSTSTKTQTAPLSSGCTPSQSSSSCPLLLSSPE